MSTITIHVLPTARTKKTNMTTHPIPFPSYMHSKTSLCDIQPYLTLTMQFQSTRKLADQSKTSIHDIKNINYVTSRMPTKIPICPHPNFENSNSGTSHKQFGK